MWNKLLSISYLISTLTEISSMPPFEIQKSIELYSSEESDFRPEFAPRFSTDVVNRMWYSFSPCYVPLMRSLYPTFAYFSGHYQWNNNGKVTGPHVVCDNNKSGKNAGLQRTPPRSFPSRKQKYSPVHGEHNFPSFGMNSHGYLPPIFWPDKLEYSGEVPQYYSYHPTRTSNPLHTHSPYLPHHFHHSYPSFDPLVPKYPYGHYYPHSVHHSQGHINRPEYYIENSLPKITKAGKEKCNDSKDLNCKKNGSEEQIKPEPPTELPEPGCSSANKKSCSNNFVSTPTPTIQPSMSTSSSPSAEDYPDIDVRFGESDSTMSSITTIE